MCRLKCYYVASVTFYATIRRRGCSTVDLGLGPCVQKLIKLPQIGKRTTQVPVKTVLKLD